MARQLIHMPIAPSDNISHSAGTTTHSPRWSQLTGRYHGGSRLLRGPSFNVTADGPLKAIATVTTDAATMSVKPSRWFEVHGGNRSTNDRQAVLIAMRTRTSPKSGVEPTQ